MVKLPSLESFSSAAVNAFRRFPMSMLSAIIATCVLMYLTHNDWLFKEHDYFVWGKILMCSELGLCLFMASALISEARQHNKQQKIVLQVITLAVIGLYYSTIGHYEKFTIDSFTRFSLYVIGSHLLISFAPFIGRNHINGFWQFNKALFLRFLLSALYTCVLYGGIAGGFWLMDVLLKVDIHYTKYLYVWYILACSFNTLVFLAGVPKDIANLDTDITYPKGLKTFTQFILLPLVTLYLLILYAYLFKILFKWSLPMGYVSYLVISISVAGILSLLLIYPLRNEEENKWIKVFSKWFYVALYPLIGLLAVAIFKRISDYGITENRYFILILAAWLVVIAAYFLISKAHNIKVIPVSLFVICFFTSLGPWGAFSVAQHSQKNRLEKILVKDGLLVNGKIKKAVGKIDDSDATDIESIIHYLDKANALDVIQPWFNRNFDSIKSPYSYSDYVYKTDTIMSMIGVRSYGYYGRYGRYESYNEGTSIEFQRSPYTYGGTSVKGFDYFYHLDYSDYSYSDTDHRDSISNGTTLYIDTSQYTFTPSSKRNQFWIVRDGKNVAGINFDTMLSTLAKRFDTNSSTYYVNVPASMMNYNINVDSNFVRFCFKSITARQLHKRMMLNYFNADVLSKHK